MQQGRKKQNFFPTLFNFPPKLSPSYHPYFLFDDFYKIIKYCPFSRSVSEKQKCVEVIRNYPEKTD